jgi:cellobiose-specific phosphotransferase system component IIC
LILRHPARASVLTGVLAAPALWIFGLHGIEFWIAVAAGIVIACRFLIDWNRHYQELWFDRKKPE